MQPATPLSDPGPSAATGDAFGRGAAPFETHARAIVAALGGRLEASDTQALAPLVRIAALEGAGVGSVSFLAHPKYVRHLHDTRASCVILQAELLVRAQEARPQGCAFIVHEQPYLFYARLSQWWKANALAAQAVAVPRIHPSAVVHPSARVDATARIGALCVVGEGVEIGAYTELRPRVTIEPGCRVGQRCLIHSGAVIGADGFGFAPRADKSWEKIEQLGGVWIGDDVEIGANTCIDRGALSDTRIENGVKLDNLVQIGHNVTVGEHSAFAGCAGVAGSAQIGKRCTVGGGAVVLGHLSLADDVHISASTTATRSISEPGLYSGIFPVDTNRDWERNAVIVRRLSELRDRLRKLEQQPAAMPSSPPGSP